MSPVNLNPNSKSAIELFEQQAHASPRDLAVADGSHILTYGELEAAANQRAHYLRSLGIGPESVVGLCLNRSLDWIVSVLAIVKAGGAYLPLDPAYPMERLVYMLSDSKAAVLLTHSAIAAQFPAGAWQVLSVDNPASAAAIASQPTVAVGGSARAQNLAYVIYTSGSTGMPKGVEVTRGNLRHLVDWHLSAFEITAADRGSHLAGLGFDAAVWELWPYLACGASVHLLASEATRNSAEHLRDWLISERVTVSFVATALAEQLMTASWPADAPLRLLLTGADTLRLYPSPDLPFRLVNNYGPTECTVVATCGVVSASDRPDRIPSIGRAIAGTHIYLLDENQNPVPAGTVGEIYIGGNGVARGYRFRSDLTRERFLPDPFLPSPLVADSSSPQPCPNGDARMYRTGDLARQLPNGELAFLGRVDDQIKVRGFRIEPAEVISALDTHPSVRASMVVARDDGADKRLVAYIIPRQDSSLSDSALRNYLRQQLPEHMVPAVFVTVSAFPVNVNGKLDRSLLPAPSTENLVKDEEYVAPRNPIEESVAAILAELLGLDRVGVHDNFFLLGGHSLLGTQVISRVKETFGVDLSLLTLFTHPTVSGMAEEIEILLRTRIGAMSGDELQRALAQAGGQQP